MAPLDTPDAFSLHLARLSSIGPHKLQELLRAEGEVALVSVKQTDLSTSTPTSGPIKTTAIVWLLRRRLATVLATQQ